MRKQLIGFVPIVVLLFLVDSLGDRWIVPPVIVFGTLLAFRIMGRRPVGGWKNWLLFGAAMCIVIGVLKYT